MLLFQVWLLRPVWCWLKNQSLYLLCYAQRIIFTPNIYHPSECRKFNWNISWKQGLCKMFSSWDVCQICNFDLWFFRQTAKKNYHSIINKMFKNLKAKVHAAINFLWHLSPFEDRQGVLFVQVWIKSDAELLWIRFFYQ